jgi:hypothetical protein
MRIKVTYQEGFVIEVGEQRITVPSPYMARLVSVIESAYQERKLQNAKERADAAKAMIIKAGHPDVLPFVEEKPFKHVRVRPDPPPEPQQDKVEPTISSQEFQ